jgi:hypothetical protein
MAKMPGRFIRYVSIVITGQRQHQDFANQLWWHPADRRQNGATLANVFRNLVAFPSQLCNRSLQCVDLLLPIGHDITDEWDLGVEGSIVACE